MHRKIIKVFLASPGDLKAERKLVRRVVDELNRMSAEFWNAQIDLIGWEDTVTRFGRAQELINQELDQCELFVGLMWQKWGSPPGGKDHPYTSGFEEEFKRTLERRERSGGPEMALLFKAPEPGRVEDPGPELVKVLKFKKDLIAQKKILFQEFSEMDDCEQKVRAIITDYVQRFLAKAGAAKTNFEAGISSVTVDVQSEKVSQSKRIDGTLVSASADDFLREVLARPSARETVTVADIARFRLIAASVGRQGNDERSIGPHDANAIYKSRSTYTFSNPEISSLLQSGLVSGDNENTPIWAWLYYGNKSPENSLMMEYFSDNVTVSVSSIKYITLSGYDLKGDGYLIGREEFLKIALQSGREEIVLAILEYLACWGEENEIQLLRAQFDETSSTIVERAISSAIRIAVRCNLQEAMSLLQAHATNLSDDLLNAMFARQAALPTDTLVQCLAHRSPEVRLRAINVLKNRDALAEDVALSLLEDANPAVRFEALMHLVDNGREYSLDEARKILVRVSRTRPGGFLGLFGDVRTEGREFFDRYFENILLSYDIKDLRRASSNEKGVEFNATAALYKRDYRGQFANIEKNVRDRFAAEFRRRVELIESDDDKGKIENISESSRDIMLEKALSIVCTSGDRNSLGIVRFALDNHQVPYAEEIVAYLEKFGQYEDTQRLADLSGRQPKGLSLLYFNVVEERRAAKAIVKLARHRAVDLLGLTTSSSLFAHIVALLNAQDFKNFDDKAILSLLNHDGANVRKAAALKAIASLPTARLKALLDVYLSGDQYRYYNVIHWLDLGISTPAKFARGVASRALKAL